LKELCFKAKHFQKNRPKRFAENMHPRWVATIEKAFD
jgi:hypothetical protein